MSDSADDLKARILLKELDRRARLFEILRKDRDVSWWVSLIPDALFVFAAYLILNSFTSDQAVAILVLAMALWKLMGNHRESVQKRIDTMIELLQQEGMLKSTLPAWREEGQGRSPAGDAAGPRLGS